MTPERSLQAPRECFRVLIYSPMPLDSGKGNAVSARRIAGHLQDAGVDVMATDDPAALEADIMVVLNAWRSAGVARAFREKYPGRPLVAVITGTDVYPVFPSQPEVIDTLEAATAIVAWHDEVPAYLSERFRGKTHIIYKSAPDIPAGMRADRHLPESPAEIAVLVIGHLREVKDPFRTAEAARLLPIGSRVRIFHAGGALSVEMETHARREMEENPRYTWLGELPRPALFERLRYASLTVNSSSAENSANAVIESLRCGVPVLASRIPGNTGVLGRAWPGLFDPGDSAGLARLLLRCEEDAGFYETLVAQTAEQARLFIPKRERNGWLALLKSLRN
jgi:putative glycosyltransferase (TIGR04348 family)